MTSSGVKPTTVCHVVAMPFPGRGHINPMMNLCKFLASKKPDILITFVVTEEWLGLIGSEHKPTNIRLATIPNGVIPPERLKAADFPAFYEAVMTKMEAPFEQLLDRLQTTQLTAIIADVEVLWGINVGKRRNIPVALSWTMSASFFTMLHYFNLFSANNSTPLDFVSKNGGNKNLVHVPGLSSLDTADLNVVFTENDQKVLKLALECISEVPEAQYLLFTSVYELEPQAIDTLRSEFAFPVYPIGPAIPYLDLHQHSSSPSSQSYLQWLDSQPKGSVLYISLGSFLSVSSTQMDEIADGLRTSGVRFLWVARSDAPRLKDRSGELGLVVPWCDQLRVLCHSSVGGFWTHCGWNSTLEAVFGGVPMLTFPLFLDQAPNGRQIVEEWKIGSRVKGGVGSCENFVMKRDEIAELVRKFMDFESEEVKETRLRAGELRDVCLRAIDKGGSSDDSLDAFIRDICNVTRGQ
ncbi:UDP-glucuronosyl/UDP-glucosyltransferase [Parasponia andersonii]|uniref:UDP-glucuronosyl/UDP-glucosyltransferase n=1 Tax=Parasponia andersonii TaxID=3476 RepID=A0A2P5DXI5_PARAD|nr:UDP-glucuronosyl/UDP-glucosyltransferase [Parasponia andersonii]